MKKVILLSIVFVALGAAHGFAQTQEPGIKPVKVGNQWQMPKDVLLRAKTFADKLQKSLQLDEPTTKKVFNAYMGNVKSVDEIRMGKGSEREKKEAMLVNQQGFDQTLKGILSPGQFNNYLKSKP